MNEENELKWYFISMITIALLGMILSGFIIYKIETTIPKNPCESFGNDWKYKSKPFYPSYCVNSNGEIKYSK